MEIESLGSGVQQSINPISERPAEITNVYSEVLRNSLKIDPIGVLKPVIDTNGPKRGLNNIFAATTAQILLVPQDTLASIGVTMESINRLNPRDSDKLIKRTSDDLLFMEVNKRVNQYSDARNRIVAAVHAIAAANVVIGKKIDPPKAGRQGASKQRTIFSDLESYIGTNYRTGNRYPLLDMISSNIRKAGFEGQSYLEYQRLFFEGYVNNIKGNFPISFLLAAFHNAHRILEPDLPEFALFSDNAGLVQFSSMILDNIFSPTEDFTAFKEIYDALVSEGDVPLFTLNNAANLAILLPPLMAHFKR